MKSTPPSFADIAIVGGGPAGLMAAQYALNAGCSVDLYEAKATVGRKFLLAGKGGLNLTHSETRPAFDQRYSDSSSSLGPVPAVSHWLDQFNPAQIVQWAQSLGIETFVGSSGRVFPKDMKAAPLLRHWLADLKRAGLRLHARHHHQRLEALPAATPQDPRWALHFEHQGQAITTQHRSVIFAMGGASWPQLGSDGLWQTPLAHLGLHINPLQPSNCGFDVWGPRNGLMGWSDHLISRHAGAALKSIALSVQTDANHTLRQVGECVLTKTGLEGSLVYALGRHWRNQTQPNGAQPQQPSLWLDLLCDFSLQRVQEHVCHGRGSRSWSSHLQSRLPLGPAKTALLFEVLGPQLGLSAQPSTTELHQLAAHIKALPLHIAQARPIAEAISSAGGVGLAQLSDDLQWTRQPGLFFAGEMLDWDAPTGGYLLSACLASGAVAGQAAANDLRQLAR